MSGRNPFEKDDTENNVMDTLYGGGIQASEPTVQRAKALKLDSIEADVTQGRRVAPSEVRQGWTGSAEDTRLVLARWIKLADEALDDFDLNGCLEGTSSLPDIDEGDDTPVAKFLNLVTLAASIRRAGLHQPITVVKRGDVFRIVFGERRWWAHVLLDMRFGYERIAAVEKQMTDWEIREAQSNENNAREDNNAIGRARELALLIMAAREQEDKATYARMDEMVAAGSCDRPYYAQVADGNAHRIPRGYGERFEAILGISTDQMRRYRSLLEPYRGQTELSNLIWQWADDYDWAEGFVRDIGSNLDADNVLDIFSTTEPVAVESALRSLIEQEKDVYRDNWHGIDNEKQAQNTPYRHRGDGIEGEKEEAPKASTPKTGDAGSAAMGQWWSGGMKVRAIVDIPESGQTPVIPAGTIGTVLRTGPDRFGVTFPQSRFPVVARRMSADEDAALVSIFKLVERVKRSEEELGYGRGAGVVTARERALLENPADNEEYERFLQTEAGKKIQREKEAIERAMREQHQPQRNKMPRVLSAGTRVMTNKGGLGKVVSQSGSTVEVRLDGVSQTIHIDRDSLDVQTSYLDETPETGIGSDKGLSTNQNQEAALPSVVDVLGDARAVTFSALFLQMQHWDEDALDEILQEFYFSSGDDLAQLAADGELFDYLKDVEFRIKEATEVIQSRLGDGLVAIAQAYGVEVDDE